MVGLVDMVFTDIGILQTRSPRKWMSTRNQNWALSVITLTVIQNVNNGDMQSSFSQHDHQICILLFVLLFVCFVVFACICRCNCCDSHSECQHWWHAVKFFTGWTLLHIWSRQCLRKCSEGAFLSLLTFLGIKCVLFCFYICVLVFHISVCCIFLFCILFFVDVWLERFEELLLWESGDRAHLYCLLTYK